MAEKTAKKEKRYIETVGRRKTSTARVRIEESKLEEVMVNEKTLKKYFPTTILQNKAVEVLKGANLSQKFFISAKVRGGGMMAQSEAVRHGIARALVLYDGELRKNLKKLGFLKRDPRMKERKKFGLKSARRAPQWSKR